jgi:hypothetical protein
MNTTFATMLIHAVVAFMALATAPIARAGDVRFVPPAPEGWEGVPVRLLVEVQDAREAGAPQVPDIPGAAVRVVERGRQTRRELFNNRVRISVTVTYAVEITPKEPGELVIPSITVSADGQDFRSPPFMVNVRPSDASDLMTAEVYAQTPEVYVGQPLDVVLRIAIRPYRDPTYGQLNETQMWGLVDLQGSSWGIFEPAVAELARRSAAPRSHQEQRDGEMHFVYELTARAWPSRPGVPDLGDVRVQMTYPLALREARSLFMEAQLTIADARPLSVAAEPQGIRVLPVPEEGRPPSFSGAVGRFALAVEARPTDVAVGDPITLTLSIEDRSGRANLETILPPPLADNAELNRDFRVPSEALSGVVQGNAKRFTLTIRPERAGLERVPAIEFGYFDPDSRSFEVARSAPVAITVRPAERMDLSRIVSASGSTAGAAAPIATQLTELDGGLVANKPVTPAILAMPGAPAGSAALALVAVPPLVATAALAWGTARRRHERDRGLARRTGARRVAHRRLAAAVDAAGLAQAITGFVEDSTGRAPGTVTRGDMAAVLTASGADPSLRERVERFLAQCERARYAGLATPGGPGALPQEAEAVLDALAAANLRSTGGRR